MWRISRWQRLDRIRSREVFGWIEDGKQRIGAIQILGFRIPPDASDDDFLEKMDAQSQSDYEFAEMLCQTWPDVFDLGEIAQLRNIWIAPSYARGGWGPAIEEVLKSAFRDHDIAVTKAFPLEYVGQRGPGLQRRQAAMTRYYRQAMGFELVPGRWGERGWMWRANPSRHLGP